VEETYGPHVGHDVRRSAADAQPAVVDGRPANAHPQAYRTPGAHSALCDRTFGRDDITVVRHEVADRLTIAGLSGDRLHGFVLAINEVITNVVLHAGGRGRIVVRVSGGSAYCTVIDAGPGVPEHIRSVPAAPATDEVGGRGIWLAYQLCDQVTVSSDGDGTTIEMRIALPHRETFFGTAGRAATAG
jgi:anti-sigma regulatory factor (Ser/Thr protein kinase)